MKSHLGTEISVTPNDQTDMPYTKKIMFDLVKFLYTTENFLHKRLADGLNMKS